jgi:hypothetical protein
MPFEVPPLFTGTRRPLAKSEPLTQLWPPGFPVVLSTTPGFHVFHSRDGIVMESGAPFCEKRYSRIVEATGEAVVLGKSGSGSESNSAATGTDAFLDQAFVKRFLLNYLNYSPPHVDERWAASLNMMTRNLRSDTIKAMADGNIRGKIEDEQTQSVFHLREIDPDAGDSLAFLIYGVKDVHHLTNGTEVTDHFVNEDRVRLIADRRSDVKPDGLWIAEYSERPIDGERRDRILAASDREITNE